MCLLGLLIPSFPSPCSFVVVHNRDEFLARPAAPPWSASAFPGPLLCGRDLGGASGASALSTWCGLNRETGVMVALTNAGRRSRSPPGAVSRGVLVADALRGARLPLAALRAACGGGEYAAISLAAKGENAAAAPATFAAFNIVIAALSPTSPPEAWLVTNRPEREAAARAGFGAAEVDATGAARLPPGSAVAVRIGAGAHALANSFLDDARWAKVGWMRSGLAALTAAGGGRALGGGAPAAAGAAGAAADDDARVLLREVIAAVAPLATHTASLASERCMPDLSWSVLSAAQERYLQDHAFVPPLAAAAAAERYGTRATTLMAAIGGSLYYCYASFFEEEGGGEERAEGGAAFHVEVAGLRWWCVRVELSNTPA